MTKSVTTTDALVLSPVGRPEAPADLKGVFDAFTRVVVGLEEDRLRHGHQGRMPIVTHAAVLEPVFRPIPLLGDGRTFANLVPAAWNGQVTRDVVADWFHTGWRFQPGEPGWGVRTAIVDGMWEGLPQGSYLRIQTDWPLVDPVGDAAALGDETTWPVSVHKPEPWDGLLLDWERRDGYFGGASPGSAWLAKRSARVRAANGRWWWQLRGLRDAGDAARYRGQWRTPVALRVYLGWPAYLYAAAGVVTRCPACGERSAIQGRLYCGAPDCNRMRAAERQRTSRRVPNAPRRSRGGE